MTPPHQNRAGRQSERGVVTTHMDDRLARIQDLLRRRDLAAVICCRPPNILACTGYWPVIGNSVAVITRERAIGLIVPEDEQDLARKASVGKIVTFQAASLSALKSTPEQIGRSLRRLAAKLNCSSGRFGHDAGPCMVPTAYAAGFHLGVSLTAILDDALAPRSIVDLSSLLAHIRAVLTPAEVDCVKTACLAAKIGFQTAKREIKAGMTEMQIGRLLAGAISNACSRPRTGAFGFCMSGPNSADAYRAFQLPGARALERRDIALLHANSYIGGYWTDITRTYLFGAANDRAKAVQAATSEATRAALDAIRPGARGRDVDRAARSVMKRAGFGEQFKHATGHGVGFSAIDHNAIPRIHPKSDDVLETGMVFNIEPAAYFPAEFGVRLCNMVAVTDTGCELLTGFT